MPVPDLPVDDPTGKLAVLLDRLYLRSGKPLKRQLADAITNKTFTWRTVLAILAALGVKSDGKDYQQARSLRRRVRHEPK